VILIRKRSGGDSNVDGSYLGGSSENILFWNGIRENLVRSLIGVRGEWTHTGCRWIWCQIGLRTVLVETQNSVDLLVSNQF
jgi:hypothetical protein